MVRRSDGRISGQDPADGGDGEPPVVIVLGRSNHDLGCPAMDAVVRAFAGQGVAAQAYPNPYDLACRALDATLAERLPRPLAAFCLSQRLSARLVKNVLRAGVAMGRWQDRAFLRGRIFGVRRTNRRDLARHLHRYRKNGVILLSHSAGAVLGTAVAGEPAVRCQICFGYPFRHPDRGEQRYRTRDLAGMAKPLLIFQGDKDAYGTVDAARRYALSPRITLIEVRDDHDYRLAEADEATRIATFAVEFAMGTQATVAELGCAAASAAGRLQDGEAPGDNADDPL